MPSRPSRIVVALTFLSIVPAAARAQEIAERTLEEAQGHFVRGTAAFDAGDYDIAVEAFERAYDLTQHPDLLYNLYSANERFGQLEAAIGALEGYLRDGDVPEARRGPLTTRLERLRQRSAERTAAEEAAAAQAEQERAEAARALEAERDEREAAEARASEEREQRVAEQAGQLEAADGLTLTGITLLLGAGLGALSFGVLAGLSEGEKQSLADGCGIGMLCRREDVEPLNTLNLAADVTGLISIGLAVVGASLLLIGEAMRPSIGDSAWLMPVISPDSAGLTAGLAAGGEF